MARWVSHVNAYVALWVSYVSVLRAVLRVVFAGGRRERGKRKKKEIVREVRPTVSIGVCDQQLHVIQNHLQNRLGRHFVRFRII